MAAPGEAADFPRGGRDLLGLAEKKRLRREAFKEAEADFLAGDHSIAPKRQKKGKAAKEDDEDLLLFAKHTSESEKLKYVELLKFKTLSVGAKVWGAVASILPRELQISLPDGLRASVPIHEASDVLASLMKEQTTSIGKQKGNAGLPSLQALFQVGQLVRGVVIKLEEAPEGTKGGTKRRVVLSLTASKLNQGTSRISLLEGMCLPACVKDVEDHGYSLTLGIKGTTAFMDKEEASSLPDPSRLTPGVMLDVIIRKATDTRLLTVSAQPKLVSSSVMKEDFNASIGTLQPGSLVNAKVVKVLDDGLSLSFLTYFSGTVDSFHIPQGKGGRTEWKSKFSEGQKMRARILYVDPGSKKVCLSLLPHLLACQSPSLPEPGALIEGAEIAEVQSSVGAMLRLPDGCAAFCHISDVSDERVDKLEKVLKPGQKENVRVIGSRLMDSLAVVSLKPSAIEQYLVAGIQPGQVVKGEVVLVDENGMLVKISKNINAFVANEHISDLGEKQGKTKHKVGSKVEGRILRMDPVKRRTTMTLQKSLLTSKAKPLTSFEEAKPGAKAHGIVNGFAKFGMFVQFYGDVKGLVHNSEMGLEAGADPSQAFKIGQVVRVKVLSSDPANKRIQLSMSSKKGKAEASSAQLQAGDTANAVVLEIREDSEGTVTSYKVDLQRDGASMGTGVLETAHLADHPVAVEAFQESIQVGSQLGKVLVLDQTKNSMLKVVTRKTALMRANEAKKLPGAIEDIVEGQTLHGFVANVAADAVFIRFLGGLTGRAGLTHLSDAFVSDPSSLFTAGQTVIVQVLLVNRERGTFGLSLKLSVVGDSRSGFLKSLFEDLEAAYVIKAAGEAQRGEAVSDWSKFKIGSVMKAVLHERKDYGLILDLEDDPNLVGLAPLHQVEDALSVGDEKPALILDSSKVNGIVDLTLKSSLLPGKTGGKSKKQDLDLKIGTSVSGEVQMVRDEYSVVTIPSLGNQIGFVGLLDFNSRQDIKKHALFSSIDLTIIELPSDANGGRLILAQKDSAANDSKRKKTRKEKQKEQKERYEQSVGPRLIPLSEGTMVEGKVTNVGDVILTVMLSTGHAGRIHITQITDEESPKTSPLSKFKEGDEIKAVVISKADPDQKPSRNITAELSLKPSVVQGTKRAGKYIAQQQQSFESLSIGDKLSGFISKVEPDFIVVAFSPSLTGRISVLDASSDPNELNRLEERFTAGQTCSCTVIGLDEDAKRVELALPKSSGKQAGNTRSACEAKKGALLMGRVLSVTASGVRVHLGPNTFGSVHLAELHDSWVENAVTGIKPGTFVRCKVLENPLRGRTNGKKRKRAEGEAPASSGMTLSTRESLGGAIAGLEKLKTLNHPGNPESFAVGNEACGYVKSASKAGVFVALNTGTDARIKLNNLADSFVEDPAVSFPLGKFVKGKVVTTEPRLELSLRTGAPRRSGLKDLKVGQIVKGKVIQVKEFGIFVQLDDHAATGFVHKSEVSDKFVKDVTGLFTRLQAVRGRVIEVDAKANRLKLTLKQSLVGEGAEDPDQVSEGSEEQPGPDLDEEMLAMEDADSEDGSDWRNAIGDPSSEDDEELEIGLEEDEAEGSEKKARKTPRLGDKSEEDSDSEEDDSESAEDSLEEAALEEQDGSAHPAVLAPSGGVGWGEDSDDDVPATNPQTDVKDAAVDEPGLSKRKAKRQKREEEASIRQAEMARLDGSQPQSAAAFEMELMGSPYSSRLWIQYMAFNLSLGELGKARAVAEQALQRIAYREEDEKFNIWVAWLNLELQHGDPPEEAVTKLFQRALTFTNQKKLYMALLQILEKAGKEELLQQTYKAVNKKYPSSAKFWLHQLAYAQRKDDAAFVASVLEKAVQNTPTRKHVKILRQSAIQEFKFGSAERARSTFESLLRNYPKRLDLWSIYIDQEIKQADKARIRSLFARATSLQIPAKKIKFLFKRQLEYEKEHGNAQTVEDVKQAARRYVEEHLNGA